MVIQNEMLAAQQHAPRPGMDLLLRDGRRDASVRALQGNEGPEGYAYCSETEKIQKPAWHRHIHGAIKLLATSINEIVLAFASFAALGGSDFAQSVVLAATGDRARLRGCGCRLVRHQRTHRRPLAVPRAEVRGRRASCFAIAASIVALSTSTSRASARFRTSSLVAMLALIQAVTIFISARVA